MKGDNAAGIADRPQAEQNPDERWRHVPLALYTIPMSLVGLGLAMRRAATSQTMPPLWPALTVPATELVLFASALALGVVVFAHAMKLVRHPDQMRLDLTHPVRICFAAALPMTLVLQAAAVLPYDAGLARGVWFVGSTLYAVITVAAVAVWQARSPIDPAALNPVWFLPIVGHVLVAHAGARLDYVETSWLVVGLSIPMWILVQTLLFYRSIFAAPLPPRMLPTLTIQIGPAPLIFLALAELQPGLDGLMRIVFYAGIGITLVLWLPRVPRFLTLPFAMPHWAFSFPLSALAASILVYAERSASPAIWSAGLAVLAIPIVATTIALVVTTRAYLQGAFSQPEI